MSNVILNSISSCQKAYINYHCEGNSMNVTKQEMCEIVRRYGDYLGTWQKAAENDDCVDYEFDDSDFEESYDEGWDEASEESSYDGSGSDIVRTSADAAGASAGAATSALTQIGHKIKGGMFITCAIAFAVGLAYTLKKPNEDDVNSVIDMQKEMVNKHNEIANENDELKHIEQEIITKSDEAYKINDSANEEIEIKQTEYQMLEKTFDSLDSKAKSGKKLDSSEKTLFTQTAGILNDTGKEINDISSTATTKTKGIQADIDGFEVKYDNVASNLASIEGYTDYAAEFDEQTKNLCVAEAVIQGANALVGAQAAFRLGKTALALTGLPWLAAAAFAMAALGLAGAAMSGIGVVQQAKNAKICEGEIQLREQVEDFNEESLANFENEVERYDTAKETLGALTINEPNEGARTFDATIVDNNNCNQNNDPNNKMKKGNKKV